MRDRGGETQVPQCTSDSRRKNTARQASLPTAISVPAALAPDTSETAPLGRDEAKRCRGCMQAKRRTRQTELSVFEVSPFAFNHTGKGNDLPADAGAVCTGHPFPTDSVSEVQRKDVEKGKMVPPTGLEPMTPQFSVECSTRLS